MTAEQLSIDNDLDRDPDDETPDEPAPGRPSRITGLHTADIVPTGDYL